MSDQAQEESYLGVVTSGWGALVDGGEYIVEQLQKADVYTSSTELMQQADTYAKALKWAGGALDGAEIVYAFTQGNTLGDKFTLVGKEFAEMGVSRLVQSGVTVVGSAFLTPAGGVALGLAAGALTDFALELSDNDPIDRVANFFLSDDETEIVGANVTTTHQRDDGSQFQKVIDLDNGKVSLVENGVERSSYNVDLDTGDMQSFRMLTETGLEVDLDFATGDYTLTSGEGTEYSANLADTTVDSGLEQVLNNVVSDVNAVMRYDACPLLAERGHKSLKNNVITHNTTILSSNRSALTRDMIFVPRT